MLVTKTLLIFFLAGLCEIGGGYLIWLWLRDGKHWSYGLLGGGILALYGVIATLQPSNFARVYATYGGVFILMSILWAMKFDKYSPDKYDIIGAGVALIGVFIIYFAPRG
ncbi:MAG: YnfA family protein [Campylobacteraceae bacterium]|jgi:small multidrug resistance family-3 protein|nr:YnfA family protein [Campylobacteraceae bacterium]